MWSFCMILFVVLSQNFDLVKTEIADVERRSVNRHRRQSADDDPKWTYNGDDNGQDDWENIGYKACGGKSQSPIFFKATDDVEFIYIKEFEFHGYDKNRTGMQLTNTGRTLKVELAEDDDDVPYFKGGGLNGTYSFTKIIFHFGEDNNKGSEHTYSKYQDPNNPLNTSLEMQMMNKNEKDEIAVLTMVFVADKKKYNKGFKPIMDSIADVKYEGQSKSIDQEFSLSSLFYFPLDSLFDEFYFRYNGSLTYPPCTENVMWSLFRGSIAYVGIPQMDKFRTLMSTPKGSNDEKSLGPCFRKQQPLHGRKFVDRNPNKPKD